ncbi:hypothetical protein K502DRAFT_368995 [Neoconidiobolus thromboides FSU 785]|nr:hypothetical protein K502DRAFT_368995 [Neoconidiobolus thromboides FSU 785]
MNCVMTGQDKVELDKDLINFYKKKFDHLSVEHTELLTQIESIKINKELFFNLDLENKKRNQEIFKLQRLLSETQLELGNEQRRNLVLQEEIDKAKIREVQDRDYIATLLSKSKSKDKSNWRVKFNNRYQKEGWNETIKTNLESENRSLKVKVSSLEIQLEEKNSQYEIMYNTLYNDRQAWLEEDQRYKQSEVQKQQNLINEIDRTKKLAVANLKELVELKRKHRQKELILMENELRYQQEIKRLKNGNSSDPNQTILSSSLSFIDSNQSMLSNNNQHNNSSSFLFHHNIYREKQFSIKDYVRQIKALRKSLRDKQKEITELKLKNIELQKEYEEHVIQTNNKMDQLTHRCQSIDRESKYKLEGYCNSIKDIQIEIRNLEKSLMEHYQLINAKDWTCLRRVQYLFQKTGQLLDKFKR